MCLAQGPQRSDAGEAGTRGPSVSSQALYHWATTLPVFSLYLVRKCLGEHWLHALSSNKISQNLTYLQIHEDCVAMETESFIPNKEFNISEGLFVYAAQQKHY